jgi:hypothetical protein
MDSTMKMNDAKGFYKLSWLQRIGFGSGDLAQNLNLSDRMYVTNSCCYVTFKLKKLATDT